MWTVLHEVPATIEINRMMGLFSPPGFPLFNLKTETTAGDEHEMCSYISRKVHIRVWRRVSERFAVTIYLRHRLTRSINHLWYWARTVLNLKVFGWDFLISQYVRSLRNICHIYTPSITAEWISSCGKQCVAVLNRSGFTHVFHVPYGQSELLIKAGFLILLYSSCQSNFR